MSTISRRAFLKTVGVGALSIAAVSVLAGCDVAGTQTPVVDATTVEAKAGTLYKVADMVTVNTESALTKNEVAADQAWAKAYVKVYTDASINNVSTYNGKSDAEKAELKANAEEKASYVEYETATVAFDVKNYGETPIVLATSSKDGKIVSDAFAASCNGKAVDCTIGTTAVIEQNTSDATTVTCTITLPVNAKSFDVVVALPGADKALKYTFENSKYVEKLDPTTEDFYKIK